MTKQILFFHGGGSEEDYQADKEIVVSLKEELGGAYSIHYPLLFDDGTPDFGRRRQINDEISAAEDNVIIVAHSLGASMLLACLSEVNVKRKIAGIFLLGTPFWDGQEDWVQAFKLRPDFAMHLNRKIPLHFYHCRDDEDVPFEHLSIYRQHLPWAFFHEVPMGGHQFHNGLTIVAMDIASI